MAKYTSGRQKNLKVGLTSYSENRTSLEVVGKVGIGTTNATSSLHVIGNQNVTGVSTLGTVKISSGIITSSNPGVTTVTFVGNLTGTASTAGFAFTAFKLEGFDFNTTTVGFATTATNVIGGIASVTQLNVSGFSTVGVLTATKIGIGTTNPTSELFVVGNSNISGIVTVGSGNTGIVINGTTGIVTSISGLTTVTFFGDLKGNSDTTGKLKTAVNIGGVSFDGSTNISLKGVNIAGDQDTSGTAASAGNLNFGVPKGIYFRDNSGTNATTSNNLTFDGNNLKVSGLTSSSSLNITGVSTFGVFGGSDGVVIKTENGAGIVTSSNPGVTTVTFYGNLVGTASVDVTNVTNTTNVIGGIASVTQLNVSGFSTVGVLTATKIGIGTTNPTSELFVVGNSNISGIVTVGSGNTGIVINGTTGIVTSISGLTTVTFFGNLTGTASTSGFAATAFSLQGFNPSTSTVGSATTATDVIGGIGSISRLSVSGITTVGSGNIGIVINGTTGIITSISPGVTTVTFVGNLTGTASTASFATTAFSLQGFNPSTSTVGSATTASNIGSGNTGSLPYQNGPGITTFLDGAGTNNQVLLYDLNSKAPKWGNVSEGSGFSVFGGITVQDESNPVGSANSITTLNFVGSNIVAIASSGSNGIATITVSDNLVGTGLSISGITTIGFGNTGVVIDGITGIITSISGVTTVTYFGDGSKLTGIKGASVEIQTSTDTPVFLTLASNAGVSSIGIATTGSTSLSFIPSTGNLGIGTTLASQKLWVNGNAIFGGTGIVTATEYNGNLKFGTPTGTGFKTGAVTITATSNTKDAVNDINSILGKLVPKPPATIDNTTLTLNNLSPSGNTKRFLCGGFTPTNNDSDSITGIASGNQYFRNTDNTISTLTISQTNSTLRGPGDSGTVTALLNNTVGVGTTTLSPLSSGSNNGTFGNLVISSDQDAIVLGITSGFYEVYDASIINAICPDGFNSICIRHVDGSNTYTTTKAIWYEDPSIVSSPILTSTTPTTPSSPVTVFSSGIPHYTESSSNAFRYIISCENATGDMYTANAFLSSGGATTGFSDAGSKSYTDFGGTNPPIKDFGVGVAVTCAIIQTPRNNVHTTVTTDATKFSSYTAFTPYGNGLNGVTVRATIPESVNIMGTAPTNTRIDENNMTVVVTGGTNFSATRVGSGTSIYDTPVPISPTWVSSSGVSTHEAVVRGGVLRHDVTNYTTGFLPVSTQNYSIGRSGNQYFQVKFLKPSISQFSITVTGTFAGCWVCLVDNPPNPVNGQTWVQDLTGNGNSGWGNMMQKYKGSGVPTFDSPGCANPSDTVLMTSGTTYNNTTFTCVFGQHSSGTTGTILVRWKLTSGQQITSMSFTVTA